MQNIRFQGSWYSVRCNVASQSGGRPHARNGSASAARLNPAVVCSILNSPPRWTRSGVAHTLHAGAGHCLSGTLRKFLSSIEAAPEAFAAV